MSRFSPGDKLVLASHNPGKVREINDLIAPFGLTAMSAAELDLPEPEETGLTFRANAEIKAVAAAEGANLPSLSDDSGLSVAALDGNPGIYSARWAGPDKDFAMAMRNVEEMLQAKGARTPDQRRAKFICALCLAFPGGEVQHFEGEVEGHLVWPPRGGKGFGYDPVFQADGHGITFGEMEPAAKHAMSHRARAFEKLVSAVFESR